ncbi:UDP-glucose 4-epimerase GalE [Ideonella sp.]|uniref:UDP-glucose 4-epimerase GalE n=1 Tax=Ideonella sp. TaxID=1929293 RepID=UPI003BB7801F
MAKILLTGATGYIGSHTWLALLAAGFDVVGVDDFSNSSPEVLNRLRELSAQAPVFVRADVNDAAAMDAVFAEHRVAAVVHFAAFKAVGESTAEPLKYYANNLGGLIGTCAAMRRHGVKALVFSSSATVYGEPQFLPYTEAHPLAAMNVYGRTKLMGEQILRDLEAADSSWNFAWLRYFNPVGAHESGRIGEDPRGIPNNLMPYVQQVAVGRREFLSVFGGDYDTPDGTGVRDYLHVMDLAEGHVAAVRYLLEAQRSVTVNLGTGVGVSVLELLKAFEAACGHALPYRIVDRRAGDLPSYYADASLARKLLGWQARRGLQQMCDDSWRWQQANPDGYGASAEVQA